MGNLRLKVAVVLQLTTCSGKLFQAFTLRHTNELERQFTLQCCFMILNGWPRLRITLQLIVSKREPASMSTKPCNYVIIHYQIELQSPHFLCFGFQFVLSNVSILQSICIYTCLFSLNPLTGTLLLLLPY